MCSYIPNIGYLIAIVQGFIQTRLVSNAVALSQTITFVSVLFWSVILGPIGALLAIPLTLLVRTILVDSDPGSRWWRPLLGDVAATRALMLTETTERKVERRANKAGPTPVQPAPTPPPATTA